MKNRWIRGAAALAALICFTGCAKQGGTGAAVEEQITAEDTQVEEASESGTPAEDAPAQEEEDVVYPQSIGLSGVGNARELGGYVSEDGRTVVRGRLLRTASLSAATDEDIKRLSDVYHTAVVVDLRMTNEIEAAPDVDIPNAKNIHLGIIDEAAVAEKKNNLTAEDLEGLDLTNKMDQLKIAIKLGIIGENMYIDFLSGAQGKDNYRKFFEELLALPDGQAILFHCTQGKDRTGVAAMLILSALGVDKAAIMEDFELTNTFNADLIAKEREMLTGQGYEGEELALMMTAMDEVNPQYMENAYAWIEDEYGSVVGYITKELNISEEQINTLKDKFLE